MFRPHLKKELTQACPDATEQLRERIKAHPTYNDEKYRTPVILRRFLVARQSNVDDAYNLWEGWCIWRDTNKPETIHIDSVQHILDTKTVSIESVDKHGRTCVIVRPGNHVPGRFAFEEMIRLTTWVLETSTKSSHESGGYITVIWNCTNQGLRNMEVALVTHKPGIIHIMKEYYPECLQSLLIVNANWVFKTFFALVNPFLDERTKNKIQVLKNTEDLLDHFHPHQLPEDFQYLAKDYDLEEYQRQLKEHEQQQQQQQN